jgi:hypothetical protein
MGIEKEPEPHLKQRCGESFQVPLWRLTRFVALI